MEASAKSPREDVEASTREGWEDNDEDAGLPWRAGGPMSPGSPRPSSPPCSSTSTIIGSLSILRLLYFQPEEGKPALWELNTDYYLHVTTAGDDLMSHSYHMSSLARNNLPEGSGAALSPVPACKDDFSRMKLTSFDKLIERTYSSIRDVRLNCDADLKPSGSVGTFGIAPDAAEVQIKGQNWLFGQRKHAETVLTTKVTPEEIANEGNRDDSNVCLRGELNFLSSSADSCEEDNFRM